MSNFTYDDLIDAGLSERDKLINENDKLKQAYEKLKMACIFYSDLSEYEETHDQLDWFTVNKTWAIQTKGERARLALKESEEILK